MFQELFPANKQSLEHFTKYFTDAGLKELSEYVRNQQSIGARKELQKELQEQMSRGDPFKDVSTSIRRLPRWDFDLFKWQNSAWCWVSASGSVFFLNNFIHFAGQTLEWIPNLLCS